MIGSSPSESWRHNRGKSRGTAYNQPKLFAAFDWSRDSGEVRLPSFDCKSPFILILALSSLYTTAMASRRLALNIAQGLRNRAALGAAPLKRGFATPVTNSYGVKTECTTLSNGLTVGTMAVFLGPIGWNISPRSQQSILHGLRRRL